MSRIRKGKTKNRKALDTFYIWKGEGKEREGKMGVYSRHKSDEERQ